METMSKIEPVVKSVSLSLCGQYRYLLQRRWSPRQMLPFVMLNPSTADHLVDDPTIARCMGFAKLFSYGGIQVVNLFAYRTAYPKDLAKAGYPVGPDNDEAIIAACASHEKVVVAWGAQKGYLVRQRIITVLRSILRSGAKPFCLGLNLDGSPSHPLFLPYAAKLIPYPVPIHAHSDCSSAPENHLQSSQREEEN